MCASPTSTQRCHVDPPTGARGLDPRGARSSWWGCRPMGLGGARVGVPTGAFGGAPYVAAKSVRGVPNRPWGRHVDDAPGLSVELPIWPRIVQGVRRNSPGSGVWTTPLAHSAELPYGGTKRGRGVPKCGRHVGDASRIFGGAPFEGTKRAWGAPKLRGGRHVDDAFGAFGGAPICGHEVCKGRAESAWGTACG